MTFEEAKELDCISREDLREPRFILAENDYQKGWNDALDSVYKNAPSIQPKMGYWKDITNINGTVIALRCSNCNCSPKHAIRSAFCPNCGAEMTEPKGSDKE